MVSRPHARAPPPEVLLLPVSPPALTPADPSALISRNYRSLSAAPCHHPDGYSPHVEARMNQVDARMNQLDVRINILIGVVFFHKLNYSCFEGLCFPPENKAIKIL